MDFSFKNLNLKFEELKNQRINEKKKEEEFEDKIDELNQETDILIEEIDKWQM